MNLVPIKNEVQFIIVKLHKVKAVQLYTVAIATCISVILFCLSRSICIYSVTHAADHYKRPNRKALDQATNVKLPTDSYLIH